MLFASFRHGSSLSPLSFRLILKGALKRQEERKKKNDKDVQVQSVSVDNAEEDPCADCADCADCASALRTEC